MSYPPGPGDSERNAEQPAYGEQPPAYGQQPPAYGEQPPPGYGEQPPAYGEQPPPGYGEQPPAYGQQPPPGYGAPPPPYAGPYGTGYGAPPPAPPSNVPLVLSIIGIVCWFFCSPAAIVLGLVAANQFRKQGRPDTIAKVAWIGGIVMLLLGILLITVAHVGRHTGTG